MIIRHLMPLAWEGNTKHFMGELAKLEDEGRGMGGEGGGAEKLPELVVVNPRALLLPYETLLCI